VRIPVKSIGDSDSNRLVIPVETDQRFRFKSIEHSGSNRSSNQNQ
jgi:hypothetical protein